MSFIATAKTKAVKGNVKEAFKNEEGAIDLASIMVGIIVIGLVGGVIAATVFAVIPWAQDNAAKQQLDSVAAAQSAYIGLASDTSAIKFGTGAATGAGSLASEKLFDATSAGVKIATVGTGKDAHYVAAKKSSSGNIFYITDTKTQPMQAGKDTNSAAAVFEGTVVGIVATPATATTINGVVFPANAAWTGATGGF